MLDEYKDQKITIWVSKNAAKHLNNKSDKLHEFIEVKGYRYLNSEIQKAIQAKLVLLQSNV